MTVSAETRRSGGAARHRPKGSHRPSGGLLSPALHLAAVILSLALACGAAADDAIQSTAAIEQTAERYLRAALEHTHGGTVVVTASQVDPRLRLQACDAPLEGFLPPGRDPLRTTTVGVRCPGGAPWSLYIPVTVEIHSEVVVAARPLRRGTRVHADDLRLATREVSRNRHAWFTRVEEVLGLEVRRAVREGDILTVQAVVEPLLVRRGGEVIIEAGGNGGVHITGRGEALQDGREGDRIRVRNLDSGREIQGRVIAPNRIEVVF